MDQVYCVSRTYIKKEDHRGMFKYKFMECKPASPAKAWPRHGRRELRHARRELRHGRNGRKNLQMRKSKQIMLSPGLNLGPAHHYPNAFASARHLIKELLE
uniref:Uncharacterized protein n=1 Tax=Cacopsylla melanoneura TaxID=428564 RepID=A0A8D9AHW3_9HEMI